MERDKENVVQTAAAEVKFVSINSASLNCGFFF